MILRFLTIATALSLSAGAASSEETSHGALLPSGAHEVGRDRYQSPSPYAETLKFYAKVYSNEQFPRRLVADLPGVRAIHLSNPGRGGWEGLNIYELNGATRVYVLARTASPKPGTRK